MPIARVCPECGGDRYMAREAKHMFDAVQRIRIKAEGVARENGLLRFKLQIAEAERDEISGVLQRKIIRQARVIRRLEERLKAAGRKPYEGASLEETMPGAEYDAGQGLR